MNLRSISIILSFIFLSGYAFSQQVLATGPVCITVKNMDNSLRFYTRVLPFKLTGTEDFYGDNEEVLMNKFGIHYRVAHLQLGDEKIDLIDYLTAGGRAMPEVQHSNDLGFQHIAIVVSDIDKAVDLLLRNQVEFVSTNPQTLPPSNIAAAGIKAFYFHDNDNHNLELIYFPEGKGKPKWQKKNGPLFLGIDHTAIGISNTDSSLVFWSRILGLEKKGESHNLGTEQAHLNNIENAELRITGLSARNGGMGVEFLQYLNPGPGNPYPSDTQCDDLWNWLIKAECTNSSGLFDLLNEKGYSVVSKRVVEINGIKQFIARDNNGHAVWFQEKTIK